MSVAFTLAKQVSDTARELDDNRRFLSAELSSQAFGCVEAMHALAETLAGSRAVEIYGAEAA